MIHSRSLFSLKEYGKLTRQSGDSRIVYSTQLGRLCPICSHPIAKCTCRKQQPRTSGDGIVRVQREVKGHRGKTVTSISGVPVDDNALRELATELKRQCGTGGSVKNGVILIQGDHRAVLEAELEKRGYMVKQSGG